MKSDTHPQIFPKAKVTCTSCKAVFAIPGTMEEMKIEICSNCHPVYTGKFRAISSSGRVDRFKKKMASAKSAKSEAKPKKRKMSGEEKLRLKLEEARAEKEEKKKAVAKIERERAKRAAEKTVIKKGKNVKKPTDDTKEKPSSAKASEGKKPSAKKKK